MLHRDSSGECVCHGNVRYFSMLMMTVLNWLMIKRIFPCIWHHCQWHLFYVQDANMENSIGLWSWSYTRFKRFNVFWRMKQRLIVYCSADGHSITHIVFWFIFGSLNKLFSEILFRPMKYLEHYREWMPDAERSTDSILSRNEVEKKRSKQNYRDVICLLRKELKKNVLSGFPKYCPP